MFENVFFLLFGFLFVWLKLNFFCLMFFIMNFGSFLVFYFFEQQSFFFWVLFFLIVYLLVLFFFFFFLRQSFLRQQFNGFFILWQYLFGLYSWGVFVWILLQFGGKYYVEFLLFFIVGLLVRLKLRWYQMFFIL